MIRFTSGSLFKVISLCKSGRRYSDEKIAEMLFPNVEYTTNYIGHRVLQDEGFETELTQATRDGGRDIVATKYEMGKPIVFYIECKRYGRRNSVGVSIVRSLYGVQTSDQINKSILVTTGHVTRGARRFVEKQNTMMSILDVNEIHHLIQRSAMKYR